MLSGNFLEFRFQPHLLKLNKVSSFNFFIYSYRIINALSNKRPCKHHKLNVQTCVKFTERLEFSTIQDDKNGLFSFFFLIVPFIAFFIKYLPDNAI